MISQNANLLIYWENIIGRWIVLFTLTSGNRAFSIDMFPWKIKSELEDNVIIEYDFKKINGLTTYSNFSL